jgi:hypothetical protein
MHYPASELHRITLPRTPVNKDMKKDEEKGRNYEDPRLVR